MLFKNKHCDANISKRLPHKKIYLAEGIRRCTKGRIKKRNRDV